MRNLGFAISIALLPFAAQAADLSNDYAFIQDNAPPAVGRSVIGHLELSAGWLQIQTDGEGGISEDAGLFEGWGRANVPFAGNWNIEIETGGGALFKDGSSASNIGAFGHLWGNWNGFRAGGFGGVTFYSSGLGGFAAVGVSEFGTVGLEAEADLGNLTLGAQGSYSAFFDCSGFCPEVWGARAWLDLYIAANTRLGIEGGYWSVENVPSSGSNGIWSVAGTAEHRFAGSPISLYARGAYENAYDDAVESVVVTGGLRVLVDGGMTLEEHDRQVPFDMRHPYVVPLSYASGLFFKR